MDKIKQLEVKKLIKELNFVESDYTYKNEMVNEIEALFISSVNDFLEKHPDLKEIFDNKVNQKIENIFKERQEIIEQNQSNDFVDQKIEEDVAEQEVIVDFKVNKLKKLYREIVKVTHPDKTKNRKLNDVYVRATKCYDSLDVPGIYSICDELAIDYEIDDEDFNLIVEKINKLRQGIFFMESTLTWKWYKTEDISEKKQIVLNYVRSRIWS